MTEQIELEVADTPKKLTKKQREFFTEYTKGIIQGIVASKAHPEYVDSVLVASGVVLDDIDLKDAAEAVGQTVLAVAPFNDVTKVDKFLSSEAYLRVMAGMQEALRTHYEVLDAKILETAKAVDEIIASAEEVKE